MFVAVRQVFRYLGKRSLMCAGKERSKVEQQVFSGNGATSRLMIAKLSGARACATLEVGTFQRFNFPQPLPYDVWL